MSDLEFARRLAEIVRIERRASRESVRETHELPIEERVAIGEALRGLFLAGRDGASLRFRCEENASRFREGDLVWISSGDPLGAATLAGRLADLDPVRGEVTIELESRRPEPFALTGELVLDRRDLDLGDRELDALRAVFGGASAFQAARDLLAGRARNGPARAAGTEADARRAGLDPTQIAAFLAAVQNDFVLVQGPPGAGKTTLAAAIVRAFVRAGLSVCITAFTHRAVNNLLLRLADATDPLGVRTVKIERGTARDFEGVNGVEVLPSARAAVGALTGGEPCVVGVTTHSAAGLLKRRFDLVLVDEAGQVSLPHGAAALALADRHVLVGDHHQLPPLIVGRHRDSLARTSLFEHLHAKYGSLLLDTTYRMNASLCALPSAAFYAGRLAPAALVRDRRLECSEGPWFAPEPEAMVIPLPHRGARVLARSEAEVAAELVARAIAAGIPPSEIAVIAPHRAQGNRIRSLLRERLKDVPAGQRPVVDTVERLQGGERDVIILSLTASDPEAMYRDAAFFFSPNRLNVSLTRARRKLIVLMSDALLDAFPDDADALYGSEILRRLYREWPHAPAPELTPA